MAEEQDPSVRKNTLQEQYVELLRIIAELETEGIPETWKGFLPTLDVRKKGLQTRMISGLKVELESIGKELEAKA